MAYPTNFAVRIGDKRVNSFHPSHVERLRELGDRIATPELNEWADRWTDYMRAWSSRREYAGLNALMGGEVVPVARLAQHLDSSRDP